MPTSPKVLPTRVKHDFQQKNYLFIESFTLSEAAQNHSKKGSPMDQCNHLKVTLGTGELS